MGKTVKKYGIPRNKLVIMTKCYKPVQRSNDKEASLLTDLETNAGYVN